VVGRRAGRNYYGGKVFEGRAAKRAGAMLILLGLPQRNTRVSINRAGGKKEKKKNGEGRGFRRPRGTSRAVAIGREFLMELWESKR